MNNVINVIERIVKTRATCYKVLPVGLSTIRVDTEDVNKVRRYFKSKYLKYVHVKNIEDINISRTDIMKYSTFVIDLMNYEFDINLIIPITDLISDGSRVIVLTTLRNKNLYKEDVNKRTSVKYTLSMMSSLVDKSKVYGILSDRDLSHEYKHIYFEVLKDRRKTKEQLLIKHVYKLEEVL